MLPEVDHMRSILQLAAMVETILDERGCNRHSESWSETSARLLDQDPELAGWLKQAQARWVLLHRYRLAATRARK